MKDRNENRQGYIETKLGNLFKNSKKIGLPGLPIYSVTIKSGLIHRKTLDRKMAPDLPPEKSLLVEPGDIVYNMMRMWQGAVGVCRRRGVVSPAYVVCNPNNEIDSNFAYYLFKSPYILHKLKSFSYGITGDRLRLYFKDFAMIPIKISPLLEQKKCAEILSTWETAIKQTRKLIDAKKRLKKTLMQQLLTGRSRFAEYGNLHSSRSDDISSRWKMVKLKKIVSPIKRKNTKGLDKVLTASGEHGLIDQRLFFQRSVAGQSLKNYYLLKKGEFAYNRSSMNNYPYGAIKRLEKYEEGILSTLYICFSINEDGVFSDYYMHLFESGLLNRQLRGITQVGARAHGLLNVSLKDFLNINVRQPSHEEQVEISDILSAADCEINQLEKKLKAL